MNIAIIGAGLIGNKRADNLPQNVKLYYSCDTNLEKAKQLAQKYSCQVTTHWHKIIEDSQIDAVVISTTNNMLTPIASEAIKRGKHVLVEKPGARSAEEFRKIIEAYRRNKVVIMVGYNHRYHPAVKKAKEIIDTQQYGPILFLRARYGHGGRLNYEKEWRFNPKIAGGGELLDQGSHLIDLVNYFAGPMMKAHGFVSNLFWKSKLEDATFFQLKNKKNQFAHLSATAVEWKNIFDFEIMLEKAKLHISGLGGSYGPETLTLYKMKPQMGPPDIVNYDFSPDDRSWYLENEIFFNRIKQKDTSPSGILQAKYVLETVDKIYKFNIENKL